LQHEATRNKQRNVRGSVRIFRLDDVGLRRTLGGRLKTDPQLALKLDSVRLWLRGYDATI
jgi:hypothetical protein